MITFSKFKKYILFHKIIKNVSTVCYNCSYVDDATGEVRVEDCYVGKSLEIIIKGFLKGRNFTEINNEVLEEFFKWHAENATLIGLCWNCELE